MSEIKKQCYLWGVWLCWGISIVAFKLSIRTPLYISLSVMAYLILLLVIPFLFTKRTVTNVFNFNRKEERQMGEKISSQDQQQKIVPTIAPSYEEGSMKETVISFGSVLCGEINNENNISINGVVEGDLTSQKTTQIGKEGKVIGNVKSVKLVVNGLLKGSCYAKTVIIMSRGRIEGEVFATEFSIEKGGVFVGNSRQIEEAQVLPEKKKEKKLTVSVAEPVQPSLTAFDNTQKKNVANGNKRIS
ncbi:bactofilin family protein [Erwinia sorbitola]|uniref:Polymer-forming cytoskeletal protein n=1 Tax=Erwinia sorbitola TaxID=2681984 RepID=A0ABW9RIK3_9GAMM|nr:polymer-forming cytoskeletal protein [Erwinia sorbitola]MTD29370.1 hypothetical protein [Erwinia sorbitola]